VHKSLANLEKLSASLKGASAAIKIVGTFMGSMESELKAVARLGIRSPVSENHWTKMTAKANRVIKECNTFIKRKCAIESLFWTIKQNITLPDGYGKEWHAGFATHTIKE
jgi:hypothetical protein